VACVKPQFRDLDRTQKTLPQYLLMFNVRTHWEAEAGKLVTFTGDLIPVSGNRNLEDYARLLCVLCCYMLR
jgi:hypothetical protein